MVRLQRNKYLIPSGKVIYGLITNAYNFYHPSYFLQPVVKIEESQRPLEDHPHTPLALCHTDLDTAHSCRINPTEHKPGAGRPQRHPGRHQHSLCCHRHWGCPWGGSDSASSCFPLGPRTVLAAFNVPQNQLGSDLVICSQILSYFFPTGVPYSRDTGNRNNLSSSLPNTRYADFHPHGHALFNFISFPSCSLAPDVYLPENEIKIIFPPFDRKKKWPS